MRKTDLVFGQANDSKLTRLIDDLVLNIYSVMPSSGSYPFTMLQVPQKDLRNLKIGLPLSFSPQIIVFKRTDFDYSDLIDYITQTKEYSHIRSEDQESFLSDYKSRYQNATAFSLWKDQVTSLGIGILMQLARQNGITLKFAEVDLDKLDADFGLQSQHLKAYQVFDIDLTR